MCARDQLKVSEPRRHQVTKPPLARSLNAAILEITKRILPRGYAVAADAPSTYEELAQLLSTGAPLRVWPGGSEQTIYADPTVNHAFRAWHDWAHWIAAHPFTLEGEQRVAALQCRQLLVDYGDNALTRHWRSIIEAEVIGQAEYRARHHHFPADQVGFVLAYLDDPSQALERTW
jgi:hypothetical protein